MHKNIKRIVYFTPWIYVYATASVNRLLRLVGRKAQQLNALFWALHFYPNFEDGKSNGKIKLSEEKLVVQKKAWKRPPD